jgi:hypothetical protein
MEYLKKKEKKACLIPTGKQGNTNLKSCVCVLISKYEQLLVLDWKRGSSVGNLARHFL